MSLNDTIYITGHKHPDSDSICAAISYSYLKRQLGFDAKACRLGEISPETQYLLDRFGFEKPMLLDDARAVIKDIEIDSPVSINYNATIHELIKAMVESKRESFAVVDNDNKIIGMISKGDLGIIGLGDTAKGIELLKNTSVSDIAKTLSGTLIYEAKDRIKSGKVSMPAINNNDLSYYQLEDRIVILGNDKDAQLAAIEKNAALLILVWCDEIDEDVLTLAKEKNCSIIVSGHGSLNTSRYLYFAPKVKLLMKEKPIYFNEDEFVEDVGKKMLKTRYRSYPVVDNQNHLVGYISRFHVLNYSNKKIIMVDHNEYAQSVNGIEKADLLEVVDHHRIYDIWTNRPISFRNEIIGSTCSIVTSMFFENQIEIPKNLAGLLLGAIISDTLKFQSPTTTPKDIQLGKKLSAISSIDIDELATSLFQVSSDIRNRDVNELINQDIKKFEIAGYKVMIGQVIVASLAEARSIKDELLPALETFCKEEGQDLVVLAFTSIVEDSSCFFGVGEIKDAVVEAFPNQDGMEYSAQAHILSRKNQIVPTLTKVINNY